MSETTPPGADATAQMDPHDAPAVRPEHLVEDENLDKYRGITARAVAIGLIISAIFAVFIPYNDTVIGGASLANSQFPIGAIGVVVFLALVVNVVLWKFRPRVAFRPAELLTIWTLLLVSSGIPATGVVRSMVAVIVAPTYFSTDANDWRNRIWDETPAWMHIADREAARTFYEGHLRGQEFVPWAVWLPPLIGWGILAILFLAFSFCLASLFRRQWIENEKFAFPLVALPVAIAERPEPGRVLNRTLRSPLLWVAVALVSVVHGLNGLSLLYPTVPAVTLNWPIAPYLTVRPWDQLGAFTARITFLPLGLTYLLASEVGFSIWFFYLFAKLQVLVGTLYNLDMPGTNLVGGVKQFQSLQTFGAALALTGWTCYTGRRHLQDVWTKAIRGPGADAIDDEREILSFRATVIGLAVSLVGIGLWLYAVTVPVALILLALVSMTIVMLVMGWMVTQAGMLFMQTAYNTMDTTAAIAGTDGIPVHSMFAASRLDRVFLTGTREMLMPSILMGAKTAEVAQFSARKLLYAMVAAVGIALVIGTAVTIYLPYHFGGANSLQNQWGFRTAQVNALTYFNNAASVPYSGSIWNLGHVLTGIVGVLGLLILRANFNFGLHPLGIFSATIYAGHQLWFSIFLGWMLKTLILRYTGMRGYQAFLPFFIGLMMADILNALLWMVIGNLTGTGYSVMP